MPPELQADIERILPKLQGWCTLEKALAMATLILEEPSVQRVVEIGVYGGRSLIPQAMALRHKGRGRVYGVDPWSNQAAVEGDVGRENKDWWNTVDLEMIHRACMSALRSENLTDWAVVLRSGSQQCEELFDRLDLVHVDGNHSELASCRDLDLYLPKLRKGSYLFFDDCDWSTTSKAVQRLDSELILVRDWTSFRLYRKE